MNAHQDPERMIATIRIYNHHIGTEFVVAKYVIPIRKKNERIRGKIEETELLNKEIMKTFIEENY